MMKLPSSLPAVIEYVMPSPSGSFARTVATRVLGPASSETNVRYLHGTRGRVTHGQAEAEQDPNSFPIVQRIKGA